jgi:hypothetical protein
MTHPSDTKTSQPRDEKSKIDGRTLLQVNATVIIGVLFFLRLASVGNFGYFITVSVVAMFTISAIWIFIPIEEALDKAKVLSALGFIILLFDLFIFGFAQSPDASGIFKGFMTEAEKCARDLALYNVTYAWNCSGYSEGSLASECAKSPKSFGTNIAGCSRYVPPSEGWNEIGRILFDEIRYV